MSIVHGEPLPFEPKGETFQAEQSPIPDILGDYRVPGRGRIDRSQRVGFTFDNVGYDGYHGDTVASALLANGVHLMGRSFKYHRPRGVVTAGSEEPNALVRTLHPATAVERRAGTGRSEPNTRATMAEVYAGLGVESQNRFPTLSLDVGVVNDGLSRLFSAGFYYKTFMWPRAFWDRVYEPVIRAAAGLGRAPDALDPDHYALRHAHPDVLVVGAGPAGLAAALTAARAGLKVMIADEHAALGGSLLSTPELAVNNRPAWTFLAETVGELATMANVTLLPRTTAFGVFHQNLVGLVERVTDHLADKPDGAPRERLWRVRARRVILAQGAHEKPLVFAGNDKPGVMLASAAKTYLDRFGVLVGRTLQVVTSHDAAWANAFALAEAGATVRIADVRQAVAPALTAEAAARGIEARVGATVTATHGRKRVRAVSLARLDGSDERTVPADALLMSGGFTPALALWSHGKGALAWDAVRETYLPAGTLPGCATAGAASGSWGLSAALLEGGSAACAAADALGAKAEPLAFAVEGEREETGQSVKMLPHARPRTKAFVDFQNDVTDKDIALAVREGFRSIEHVKRYTTTGMATDQGKLSNINALMLASDALATPAPKVGLTTFRPPYTPTTFGALANHKRGATFEVTRKTPVDPWAEAHGAVFEPVSLWRRARYFPRVGETMHAAVQRECRTTRQVAGLFDASTLGKIEVVGPDAAEFLNRLYTNPFLKLGIGKCRYGVLLGEDGFIRDDGVIARLAEDRFHVTTTTGSAPRVLAMMEDYRQTEWPDLAVWLTSTTEQWATFALNGPQARQILAPLVERDIANAAFPHMSAVECHVAGVPARLMRMSFTGELGYEANVPSRHGLAVWKRLWAATERAGGCVYGTETMHALRADKGFIIVGQDTDGTVTPDEAGLGWAIGKKKADFVGMRSLSRPDMVAPGRRQLVGLATHNPRVVLQEGAQVVADPAEPVPMTMLGIVSSAYFSAGLGRSIALALVAEGRARMGETLYVPMPGGAIAATVCATNLYDPTGSRMQS